MERSDDDDNRHSNALGYQVFLPDPEPPCVSTCMVREEGNYIQYVYRYTSSKFLRINVNEAIKTTINIHTEIIG